MNRPKRCDAANLAIAINDQNFKGAASVLQNRCRDLPGARGNRIAKLDARRRRLPLRAQPVSRVVASGVVVACGHRC